MKFWTQVKDKINAFAKMPDGKVVKVAAPIMVVAMVLVVFLGLNPIALSIRYDDCAYDNYVEKRESGYSFHTTESGSFYTTHGIHPFDVEVVYLFAESEDLWEAFDNGSITIEDLDRLGFDYWFKANE